MFLSLTNKEIEKGILENLLRSPVEKVKVPEFQPHPLSRLPDELVGALHVLRVGAGVRGRHDLANLATVGVDLEAASLTLLIRGIGNRSSQMVLVCKKNMK